MNSQLICGLEASLPESATILEQHATSQSLFRDFHGNRKERSTQQLFLTANVYPPILALPERSVLKLPRLCPVEVGCHSFPGPWAVQPL